MRDVSLRIMAGEFISIVGPSGSGKSTMLGLLGVLDLPTVGHGPRRRAGRQPRSTTPPARKLRGDSIGFVFQQFHLIPHLSALGNVETALLYRDIRPRERREKAFDALDQLGLGARADHRPVQMSGGEQQRVALARAIVTDPLMVLADEPTGALDSTNAAHVLEIFRTLQTPERAVVMVTHDLTVADTAARRISMRDGAHRGRRAQGGRARVSQARDLLGVALDGLTARKTRTLMIMLGPDHRGGRHGLRRRPHRERQGRTSRPSSPSSGPT